LSVTLACGPLIINSEAQDLPDGYGSIAQTTEVSDKFRLMIFDPDMPSPTLFAGYPNYMTNWRSDCVMPVAFDL